MHEPAAGRAVPVPSCSPLVGLFFHRQRPKVRQHAVGDIGVDVGNCFVGEPPVGDVEQCRSGIVDKLDGASRRQEPHSERHRGHQGEEREWKEASHAAGVEPDQAEPTAAGLGHDDAGDEESGQCKKDVDTDVAATEPRYTGVIEHNEDHRDSANAVDVGAVRDGPVRHRARRRRFRCYGVGGRRFCCRHGCDHIDWSVAA